MKALTKIPFLIKASQLIIGLYFLISMLIMAEGIIVPVIFACLLAILFSPIVNFLALKKIPRLIAIIGVLLLAIIVTAGLITLIAMQAKRFGMAWPHLVDKLQQLLDHFVAWVSLHFNVSTPDIYAWINNKKGELLNKSTSLIGGTINSVGGFFAKAVLVPVYVFMLLFYHPHIIAFVHQLFGADNDVQVGEILNSTKGIIKSYLVGLFTDFFIIAVLDSVAFLILGINYAILFGVVAACLNALPFIGNIIAVTLFVSLILLSKSPIYVLYYLLMHIAIQFTDNHLIIPKIVGSKVKLNALICLIAIFAGGGLWGVPGMFLAIPLTAIIKMIFDHVDSLKPWGFLLGETIEPPGKIKFNFSFKDIIHWISVKLHRLRKHRVPHPKTNSNQIQKTNIE